MTTGWTPADLLNFFSSDAGLRTSDTLPYGPEPRQTLDAYQPRGGERMPVVVFFYGGSWQSGSKAAYRFVGHALARRGYITIIPDYRVYPDVRFPDFLRDGAAAVAWAWANAARFGGDADLLFLAGHSAGAYIAAMLALDDQWLSAKGLQPRADLAGFVGLAGPYDFLPIRDATLKTIFGGPNRAQTQPTNFVRGGEAPVLLLTGVRDHAVSPRNSARLAQELVAAGSKARVISYRRVRHLTIIGAFAPPLRFLAPVLDDVDAFIRDVAAARAHVRLARCEAS